MNDQGGATPTYSIGAVARMVVVPVATLRSWEERYGIVVPARSEAGQRLYSRDQLEQLKFLRSRIDEGMSPADAHRLLQQRSPVDSQPVATDSRRKLLILLAERDPYAAELSEYFLRTEGYGVETVFDPAEALRRFDEVKPDLAIVELLIQGGDGFELCAEFSRRGICPVIAISPLAIADNPALEAVDAVLRKPLRPLDLVSTVKDLLGTSAF